MRSGKKILAVDFVVLLICISGLYQIGEKSDLPVFVSSEDSYLIIDSLKHSKYDYLEGSFIVRINGAEVNSTNSLEFILDGLRVGDSVKVSVIKQGKMLNAYLPLIAYYNFGYMLIVLITGLLTFTLALFAYFKSNDRKVAGIFHWLAIATSVILMTSWGNYRAPDLIIGGLTRVSLGAAYSFLPVLFIHFTLLYPFANNNFIYRKIRLIYGLAILFFLTITILFVIAISQKSINLIDNYYSFFTALRIYLSLFLIAGVINFILSYLKSDSHAEKKKLKWALLGITIGPAFYIIFWVIPGIYLKRNIIPEELLIIFISFIPITLTISILKYHLLDVDFVLNRGLVYFLSLSAAILLYLLIVLGFDILLVNLNNSVPSILAATVIALLFNPAKNRIQNFVDKKFFKINYDFRKAIKEVNVLMDQSLTGEQLSDIFLSELDKLIPVVKTAIMIYDNKNNLFALLKGYNFSSENMSKINRMIHNGVSFHSGLANKDKVEKECEIPKDESGTLKEIGIVVAIPILISGKENFGLLLLGDKKSGLRCSPEDIDLLQSISSKFASEWERIELNNRILQEKIQKEKLKELSESKSFFISSVSHEFKTPLTSIKMFSELLRSNKEIADAERFRYLEIIEGECERLDRMVENVLNLSKIEKGIKLYNFELASLNNLIRKAVAIMEYQLKLENCQYSVEFLPEDKSLMIDYDLMIGAIINLISNAIKYSTSPKQILISINETVNAVRINVKDRGIGISKEDLSHILDPYYRGNNFNKTKTKTKGFGIGLALVKNIVQAHNGQLEIESSPCKGSVFTINLPKGKT